MPVINKLEFTDYAGGDAPQTKFGGQPDWLESPQWPLSAELEEPMRFIAQIHLGDVFPEQQGKMAYIFMTEDDEDYVDGTWEHDGGENAVVIQPGGHIDFDVDELAEGPSREVYGVTVAETEIEEDDLDTRLGGTPGFMQGEEYPGDKSDWNFLAQLDSCGLPFEVNFGDAGVAYIFVNADCTEGRFLWQCG